MEETIKIIPKFKVGDRVCSKKTGLPVCGTVGQVMSPYQFIRGLPSFINSVYTDKSFSRHYPDYRNKPVYVVGFDEPQKTVSKDDVMWGLPRGWGDDNIEEICDSLFEAMPTAMMAAYPEDDLELL